MTVHASQGGSVVLRCDTANAAGGTLQLPPIRGLTDSPTLHQHSLDDTRTRTLQAPVRQSPSRNLTRTVMGVLTLAARPSVAAVWSSATADRGYVADDVETDRTEGASVARDPKCLRVPPVDERKRARMWLGR